MKVLVVTKNNIEKKKGSTKELTDLLKRKKILFDVVSYDKVDEFYEKIHDKKYRNTYDVLISYGGDGTILKSARIARKLDIPILGINVGTLGFLTTVNYKDDIDDAISKLLKKNYQIENRFMLDVRVYRDDKMDFKAYAVNEATVTTSNICKIGRYRVSIGDPESLFNEYKADGLIISTPTGSTAHSLSAGGPIVTPGADCLILTAVCPHAFNQRSIVINANDKIYIDVINNSQLIDIDGRVSYNLMKNDKIVICKLPKIVKYIIFDKNRFYQNLKNKINLI